MNNTDELKLDLVLIKTDYLISLVYRLGVSTDYILFGMTNNEINHKRTRLTY